MASPNPAPRKRIRAVESTAPQPRARSRPEPQSHGLYEPYDGPAPLAPQRDPNTQELVAQQRGLNERVDLIADLDKGVAEELLLSTLHQFILAKTPPDVICQRMQISIGSYKWLREKLMKRIREQAKGRDPFDYIAPMIAEVEEAKGVAWREIALAKPAEWSRRMRAIDVINRCNADINRLLQVAGMFDNSPMRAPLTADDDEAGSANVLKEMARNFLSGGYHANADYRKAPLPGDTVIDG